MTSAAEYRAKAVQMHELAVETADPALAAIYLDLAKDYEAVAKDYEAVVRPLESGSNAPPQRDRLAASRGKEPAAKRQAD